MTKFKIPKKFKIFGKTVTVEYRNMLKDEENCKGMAHYRKQKIFIQKNGPNYHRGQEDIEQSFFHELTHWVLAELGYDKLQNDETFIERVSKVFHQAFITMEH